MEGETTLYSPGATIAGRYRVHQALLGGMGEIYLCVDLSEQTKYALKTIKERYAANHAVRAAFSAEVAIWVALEKHPNVVRCFGMRVLDNRPFMILEWVEGNERYGTDLHRWLRLEPLDLRTALQVGIDVCCGLEHAVVKQPGFVHCDLKPRNILLTNEPVAKVSDFGLSRVSEVAGLTGGEPYYRAPEQWQGEKLDARADIYALGCILYEMLSGRPPYDATELASLRRLHLEAPVPPLPPSAHSSAELETLIARCLAKSRQDRIETATTLLGKLSKIYLKHFGTVPRVATPGETLSGLDYANRGVTRERLKNYEEALVDYDRALELDPTLADQIYPNRGNVLANLGRYEKAFADYALAIQLCPRRPSAYNNRGYLYITLQRYREALPDLNRAVDLDPSYAQALTNRGFVYEKLEQYDAALADFGRAVRADPSFDKARANIALLLQRHFKAPVESIPHLRAAAQVADPLDAKPYKQLALYSELAAALVGVGSAEYGAADYVDRAVTFARQQQYDAALVDFERALNCDARYPNAYYNRGNAYEDLKRYDDALADYTQAIELDPQYALAYHNRGGLYARFGRYAQAVEDLTRSIELDPNYVRAYNNRGSALEKLQRFDEALDDYVRAAMLDPKYALANYNAGALLAKRGALEEAIPYLECAALLGDDIAARAVAVVRKQLASTSVSQDNKR